MAIRFDEGTPAQRRLAARRAKHAVDDNDYQKRPLILINDVTARGRPGSTGLAASQTPRRRRLIGSKKPLGRQNPPLEFCASP
jgi:hypothetical protein